MKLLTQKELLFLSESNATEGVYDSVSLQQAVLAWKYLKEQDILTPAVILETHKIISLLSNLLPSEKGYFRKVGVRVGNQLGLDWKKVPMAIEDWCEDVALYGNPKAMHIAYEKIHPFVDFNGRTGRLFYNWQMIKQLKKRVKVFYEKDRQDYYKWFQN